MYKIFLYVPILVTVFFISCKNSETEALSKADVLEIKEIGMLSTSEYRIAKVLRLEDDTEWYKIGERKIIIRCEAKVKAGIDLTKIKETDIFVNGKSMTIKLPPVEIVSFNIDPNNITTEAEQAAGMRTKFTQAEKQKVLQLGEQAIKDKLNETSILKDAEENALKFVSKFYEAAGFEEVNVEFKMILE